MQIDIHGIPMPIERSASGSMIDVLDRVLDKGIVIDYCARVSLLGIDLLTWIDARVVVASIDTYLQYAGRIAATRFPDPWRASPAANTPGTLVSNKNGSRLAVHVFGHCPSTSKSRPVRMNPCASRATNPATTSVRGDDPMKMNIASAATSRI